MFSDAKVQARVEAAKWPYAWVTGADYPTNSERAEVKGQIRLMDSESAGATMQNLMVGLAYPDEVAGAEQAVADPQDRRSRRVPLMTWQNDAKHYEFWVHGSDDGHFSIPKVRPGIYELHAVADGVLGEYQKAVIVVKPGGTIDLGRLNWVPVRFGRQLWQIGVPNRSASEFLRGDDHWHWGQYLEYSKLFPKDVDYTVGVSDWRKDWFIYQVPHVIEDGARPRPGDNMEGALQPPEWTASQRSRDSSSGARWGRCSHDRRGRERKVRRPDSGPHLQRDDQPGWH